MRQAGSSIGMDRVHWKRAAAPNEGAFGDTCALLAGGYYGHGAMNSLVQRGYYPTARPGMHYGAMVMICHLDRLAPACVSWRAVVVTRRSHSTKELVLLRRTGGGLRLLLNYAESHLGAANHPRSVLLCLEETFFDQIV